MSQLPIFSYTEVFSNPFRLLIKESHAIFASIPRTGNEFTKTSAVGVSRRYRSIVHECAENLIRDITCDHGGQVVTFKEMEIIWHLCEILYLDVHQTGTLILQLRNWIRMHFDELDMEAKEMLSSLDRGDFKFNGDNGHDHTYWNLLTKLVLWGDTKKAIQLLSCHHDFQRNDQMQSVATMLDSMPLSNQYIVHEFCNKWSSWSSWCKSERGTGQFDGNPYLLNIVRLLSQDSTVYDQYAKNCKTWHPLMVAYLLYSDPCIRETDLSDLCRQMKTIFKKNNPQHFQEQQGETPCDDILISAFEYDLITVIAKCCSYLDDNWWFVTHFVDLLHCSNQLHIHEIVEPEKLRETFVQDYASTLFDDELLWPIGVSYLDKCPNYGIFYLEALLSRVPLSIDDDFKAQKIVSIAKKRGLNSVSKSICVLMARGWLSKIQRLPRRVDDDKAPSPVDFSNAMYWAIKSGDSALITYMSDQYLHYYCKYGVFPDESVFDSLRRSPLENERLAFLTKYFEFKQISHESNDDLTEAGSLLRALFASKIYPKFFCQELLKDAKRLLEIRPQLIFRPDKTIDLMKSIEEITKQGVTEDMDLRKNLVRNMARALITPKGLEN